MHVSHSLRWLWTLSMPPWVPPNHLDNSKVSPQVGTTQGWDVFIGSRFLFFFLFCGLEEKTERPGKRNQWVSISQGREKPQGTQTVPHRLLTIHTPPFCLLLKRLGSVAETDGDVSLGSFVATIKGIPLPLSPRQPQNILRQGSYVLKHKHSARTEKARRINSSRGEKSIIFFSTCLGLQIFFFFLLPIISERVF